MNWSSTSDILAGLVVIYLCVGVITATILAIYFIRKDQFDREKFAICAEAILCYAPASAIIAWWLLKKLVRFLWTRDYKGWYDRQRETFQEWNKVRKKARKDLKEFKAKQKK